MGWNNISHYWRRLVGDESSAQLAQTYQQQRSPEALQQLFLRYADALYYFLRQQSNAQLAEDISQQTWLQFMQIQSAMPPYQSFKAWLFAVARHALIDEFRRQGRWQYTELGHDGELDATHDASCLHEDTADPAVMLQQAESMAVLDAAIAALPLVQKEALLLQLEGFSLQDIASITQSTPETVKSRLRYAKTALARQLNSTSTPAMSASLKAATQPALRTDTGTDTAPHHEPMPTKALTNKRRAESDHLASTAADVSADLSTDRQPHPCRSTSRLGDVR